MMREEEDEETLFDQEGLLGSGKKSSWDWEWVRRFTKTLSLSLAFFALGLCISIPGATLLDLEERTNSSTERISLIFSARSLGYLLGSVVGGVLFDYFDQQILLFYTLALTGVATVAVPWCTALLALACMIAVQGLALGVLDTGGNMFCIKIWSKSSPPYMQALHFSFAVGAFLAPLLARPFLIGEGALGSNSSVLPVSSHIPVNTRLPNLSGTSGAHGHMKTLTEAWWLADSRHDRMIRDADLNVTSFVKNTMGFQNSTGNVSVAGVPIPTSPVPRPSKPVVSDAKHLSVDSASGEKIKTHILEHKDDQRPETVGEGDIPEGGAPTSTEEDEGAAVAGDMRNSSDANDTALVAGSVQNGSSSVNQSDSESGVGTASPKNSSLPLPAPSSSTPPAATSTTTSTTTTSTTTTTTTTSTTTTTTTPKPTTQSTTTTTTTTTPVVATSQSEAVQTPSSNSSSNGTVDAATTTTISTTTTRKPKPEFLDVITSTLDAVKHMSKIQFAYMIIGLILMGDAILFLGLYCKDCHAGTLLHQINALGPSPPPTSSCFRVSLLSLLFVFFLFYVGTEVAFGGLVTTFAVESELIQWSRPQGATLAALFWGSIAVGRGMGIFIARCFKPPCMLVVDLVLMVAGAIILSFTLTSSPVMLWAGTVTLGLGMSSIFPTAVSWADCYYPLTGRAAAVFITGSGVGEMVIPVATGYLFEKFSSLWLMYMVLGLSGLVAVVFVGLQCIASHQPAPTSVSKMGFLPLHNEEEEDTSIAMDDMVNGSTGYTENSRRRPLPNNHVEDAAEEETTKLVDLSE